MKRASILSIFVLITHVIFGQKTISKIDSLNSAKDIEKLIHSFNKDYERFSLRPVRKFKSISEGNDFCVRTADSLKITKSFYKSDFDNNGYTDLLVIGNYYDFKIFVVLNYGNDSLKLNSLTRRSFQECTFPKIIHDTLIRYYYMPQSNWRAREEARHLQHSDLIFKFGDFIEFNAHPRNYAIEKIEYQTTMCYGTCPQFFLSIDKNRQAMFRAESYNTDANDGKEIQGTFRATLAEKQFLEIINLLDYIDFPSLKNNYAVTWTDDQSCTLIVTYNNGMTKKIKDYGLIGTYGLDRLYQLLFDLRNNQQWNKKNTAVNN